VEQIVNELRGKLRNHRPAALKFQYTGMSSTLQQFIRAGRSGDWVGHLISLGKMPYFAASGHHILMI